MFNFCPLMCPISGLRRELGARHWGIPQQSRLRGGPQCAGGGAGRVISQALFTSNTAPDVAKCSILLLHRGEAGIGTAEEVN